MVKYKVKSRGEVGVLKTYTIIGGVNGVGKSSFTGALKEQTTELGIIINVDQITADLGGDPLEGRKKAFSMINDCIQKNVSFTQETTLSGRKTEETAIRVKEQGYHIHLYYIALDSAEESLSRIENRVRRGGHNIGHSEVLRQFEHRWADVQKILPYCDEADFYDNENGFKLAAKYSNGQLRPLGRHRPQWLADLISFLNTN